MSQLSVEDVIQEIKTITKSLNMECMKDIAVTFNAHGKLVRIATDVQSIDIINGGFFHKPTLFIVPDIIVEIFFTNDRDPRVVFNKMMHYISAGLKYITLDLPLLEKIGVEWKQYITDILVAYGKS